MHYSLFTFHPFQDQYCEKMTKLTGQFVETTGEKIRCAKQSSDPPEGTERSQMCGQLIELFPQHSPALILSLLQENNYQFDVVFDHLTSRSCSEDNLHPANNVTTHSTVNNVSSETETETTQLSAEEYFQKSQYYRDLAAKYTRMADEYLELANFRAENNNQPDHNEEQHYQQMASLFIETSGEKTRSKTVKQTSPNPTKDDEKLAKLSNLMEIFPQYSQKLIKTLLQEKNYDFDVVCEELAAGSTVGDIKHDANHITTTVTLPSSPRSLVRSTSPTNSCNNDFSSSSSGISVSSESNPQALYEKANYYRSLAAKSHKTGPLYGQYLRMASECSTQAKKLQRDDDELFASNVKDILDLHGFEVTRGIRILERSIEVVKETYPKQRFLEVITGIGNRNANNKAPLRDAVELWLDQKRFVYQQAPYNKGSFKIDLKY